MAIAGLVGQLRSLDDNGDPQAPAQVLACFGCQFFFCLVSMAQVSLTVDGFSDVW